MAVWLFGCLVVWLFGCLAVWLIGVGRLDFDMAERRVRTFERGTGSSAGDSVSLKSFLWTSLETLDHLRVVVTSFVKEFLRWGHWASQQTWIWKGTDGKGITGRNVL